jgi:hypothetical protein
MLASDGPDVAWCAVRLHFTSRDGRGIETAKNVSPDTTGQISGTERLIGAGKTARLGLGESRTGFRKGCTNKKPHSLLRGCAVQKLN